MTGYIVDIFVGLLMAVAVLALLARRFHIPYPIFFVMGGLLIGLIPGLPKVRLDPELVFPFLSAAAPFSRGAVYLVARFSRQTSVPFRCSPSVSYFSPRWRSPGWLIYFFHLPLAVGFVLGAIISPPDAIAATAIAERLSVPRRIVTILEGESLVNDATALVAYRFAVVAVATGSFSLTRAGGQFLVVGLGGILAGLAVGWLVEKFHRRVDDAPIEITVSLLTPFAAYLAAERLGVSGVLAVVAAGLYLGWRSPEILSSRTRLQAGPVWEMVEFLLNGFVFILIGLQLPEVLHALSEPCRLFLRPARPVRAGHQSGGDFHPHPLGFPRVLSAPSALQTHPGQGPVSVLAPRHNCGVDGHARSRFARGGPGVAAHNSGRRCLFRIAT